MPLARARVLMPTAVPPKKVDQVVVLPLAVPFWVIKKLPAQSWILGLAITAAPPRSTPVVPADAALMRPTVNLPTDLWSKYQLASSSARLLSPGTPPSSSICVT